MRIVKRFKLSPEQLKALINTVDAQGETLLWRAIRLGSRGCFDELLKAGADPLKRDALGKNALQIAKDHDRVGQMGMVEKLRKITPPPYSPAQIFKRLEIAVTGNNPIAFNNIIRNCGVSEAIIRELVNTPNAEGKTLLMICIEAGSMECLSPLLAAGADPSMTTAVGGYNALHLAVAYDRPLMIAQLIAAVPQVQRSAFMNAKSDDDASPFLLAIVLKKVQCLSPLVKGGVDLIFKGQDCAVYDTALFLDADSEVAQELLRLEPRLKGIFALKTVGHVFGFDPKPTGTDHDQSLRGSAPSAMLKLISDDLQRPEVVETLYPLCTDEQRKELTSAFTTASQQEYSEEQIQDQVTAIKEGRLTIIPAGWDSHAVDVVFKDGYLVIANRGAGSTGPNGQKRTFFAAKIDPELVDERLIEQIIGCKSGKREKCLKFLYETLPLMLHAQDDDVCQALRDIAPIRQTGGTCGYASGIAALRASLALLTRDFQGAKEVSQRVALGHKERALIAFKQTPSLYAEEYRSEIVMEQTAHIEKQKAAMKANAGLVKLLLRLKDNIDDSYEVGRILYFIEMQYGIKKREALEERLASICKREGMDTSALGFARAKFIDPSLDPQLKLRAIRSFMDMVDPY